MTLSCHLSLSVTDISTQAVVPPLVELKNRSALLLVVLKNLRSPPLIEMDPTGRIYLRGLSSATKLLQYCRNQYEGGYILQKLPGPLNRHKKRLGYTRTCVLE